jgi:hypothetical protein
VDGQLMADERSESDEEHKRKLEQFLWLAKDAYDRESDLFEKLREAAYCHQHPNLDPSLTRWTGATNACKAVAQFLEKSGQSPELAAVFLEMAEGFKDMQRGIVPPIFSLVAEPLKRDRSSHRKFQHAWAAAILEFAIEGGEGEEQAANRIARSAQNWAALREQNVTGTTIVNWRKHIKCGSPKERSRFEGICKGLRSEPDCGKRKIEEVLAEGPPGSVKS